MNGMHGLRLVIFSVMITACSSVPEHNPVPGKWSPQAEPFGKPYLRFWGDVDDAFFNLWSCNDNRCPETSIDDNPLNLLALSGGGANGAFSAGILTAWSEKGTRPEFDVVTGISTGAIVSLFAFLGSDYDTQLTNFYTQTSDQDIYTINSVFTIWNGSSLLDITPLESQVRQTITPKLMRQIASEYRRGRLLLIGTTHLDSQRLAIWNMGYIASLDTRAAEKLFEDVILASSAIPGAFPPVQIDVVVDGQTYQELHVDGGMTRQVFLLPDAISMESFRPHRSAKNNLYVISNGEFLPVRTRSELSLKYVFVRSMLTLLKYQMRSDILRIYEKSQEAGIQFHLAFIDESFAHDQPDEQIFDQLFMNQLYHFGYTKMLGDQLWYEKPPVFDTMTPPESFRITERPGVLP